MNNTPFVIERTCAAPADLVWQAISDKNHMKTGISISLLLKQGLDLYSSFLQVRKEKNTCIIVKLQKLFQAKN